MLVNVFNNKKIEISTRYATKLGEIGTEANPTDSEKEHEKERVNRQRPISPQSA